MSGAEICRIIGLPGKPKGFDGGEVERHYHEGKIKEIADYCEADVVGTYRVWLRYELFLGTLSQDAFDLSERNLTEFMNRKGPGQPGASFTSFAAADRQS